MRPTGNSTLDPQTSNARFETGDTPFGRRSQVGDGTFNRRDFLKAFGGASLAAALAACAPATPTTAALKSAPVQLVYQDWRTEWFPQLAHEMLEHFHANHPEIQVFYSPEPENLVDTMLADFQAGTAADVLAGCCDWFAIWAQQGYLLDLRPFVEADLDRSIIDEWDAAQYRALFTEDGSQFALPKYHGSLGLYYNKDLFDAFGVAYPDGSWTHDDYLEAMRRLTRDPLSSAEKRVWGSMLDVSWEGLQVHVNGWGGRFVDPEDPKKSWMARPKALSALGWIRDRMWEDRVMASHLDVRNLSAREAFIQGHLAMVEDGSWAIKDVLEHARFRVGATSFPAGPERKVTISTTDGYGIYAGTRHPEAAWELLKFLVSKRYGRAMARHHLLQPARASLVDEWVHIIRNQYPEQARGLDIGAFAEGHRQGYSVTAEIFANMAMARKLTQSAWQEIFTLGQKPVDEMIRVSGHIEMWQEASR